MKFLKENEMDPKRVYIKNVIAHRIDRQKRLDYKSKGRIGIRKKDYCYFNIEFVEYTKKDFYKKLVQGNTPTMLSHLMQEHLKRKDAGFQEINEAQFMLHEKGSRL